MYINSFNLYTLFMYHVCKPYNVSNPNYESYIIIGEDDFPQI